MDIYRVYYFSLAFQSCISLGLAAWLSAKAPHQSGIKPLALFCVGIGCWALGQLGMHLGGDSVAALGKRLVNCGPINAVFFLHFVFRFLQRERPRQLLGVYLIGIVTLVLIQVLDMGTLAPWLSFRRYYFFPVWGWIPGIVVSSISVWAYLLLLAAWPAAAPKQRGKIMAIWFAGVWGSGASLMFLNASLGIDIFPYSVILLPGYALLLVFGILRYDLMVVNLWANRLLAWLVLTAITVALASLLLSVAARTGFAPLAAMPLWQLWLLGTAMLGVMLVLEGPSRRAIERLVFPGAHLEAGVLAEWRLRLDTASSWQELERIAASTLGAHLRQPMRVVLGDARPAGDSAGKPGVHCYLAAGKDGEAPHWRSELMEWEGATPSVTRVGEVFGALLAAAAARLDQLLRHAEHEKERLQQAHLLELGGLAATVAHELRNPLNIISMAAVMSPPETRAEIRAQIERADHLIQDLLSYSGEVRLNPQRVNVAELVQRVAAGHPSQAIELDADAALCLHIDPMRGEQILGNLIGNAMAMLRGCSDPRILVEAQAQDDGRVLLRVCDNGPGVPADLAADLFQPFTTRRPGGTGLGLAIVRRLVEAHGGKVRLGERAGWNCCFELLLPGSQ
ncbi:ATP-binding protein [Massilia sp. P8910]|uniref:sensor histidine kinase n=1 Tax=Massilia antarctica TaxID=2765360 RepID=UPI001E2F4E0E|nr:sensor histidine kinase [Massilia antarctica]MCE3603584.1 ATP-binding protein [Massilia antarctica]